LVRGHHAVHHTERERLRGAEKGHRLR
jgi:hypothetical protein